jgi:hypothetical protein
MGNRMNPDEDTNKTKTCPRCGETKLLVVDFVLLKSGRHDVYCRPCRREYNKIQYGNRRRGYSLETGFDPSFDGDALLRRLAGRG